MIPFLKPSMRLPPLASRSTIPPVNTVTAALITALNNALMLDTNLGVLALIDAVMPSMKLIIKSHPACTTRPSV